MALRTGSDVFTISRFLILLLVNCFCEFFAPLLNLLLDLVGGEIFVIFELLLELVQISLDFSQHFMSQQLFIWRPRQGIWVGFELL